MSKSIEELINELSTSQHGQYDYFDVMKVAEQYASQQIAEKEAKIKELKEIIRKIYVHFGAGESCNPYVIPVIEICKSANNL
jgi:hypothetical protein